MLGPTKMRATVTRCETSLITRPVLGQLLMLKFMLMDVVHFFVISNCGGEKVTKFPHDDTKTLYEHNSSFCTKVELRISETHRSLDKNKIK